MWFYRIQFHCIKMRYSIEPRNRYVKGYGFLSFAKNMGMGKKLSNKYDQKPLDSWKNIKQMQ